MVAQPVKPSTSISTHAPAGGATQQQKSLRMHRLVFLLTPLREGRPCRASGCGILFVDFYSRPCGRGDRCAPRPGGVLDEISTHAPAGGATVVEDVKSGPTRFLLTPLREGRPRGVAPCFCV